MSAESSPVSFSAALAAYQAGRLDEATETCGRILAAEPANLNALQLLGAIHYKSRRYASAQPLLQRAAELAPHLPSTHFNVAEVLSALHRYAEAVPYYQTALRLKPDDAIGLNNLGNALRALLRIPESLEAYRACLTLKPDYAPAENNRGIALYELGQIQESLDGFRAAARLDSSQPIYFNNIGNGLKELGRPAEAASFYEQAIALKPDYHEAHSNLLLSRQYDPGWSAAMRLAAHRLWGEATLRRLGVSAEVRSRSWAAEAPGEPVRVGLVSSDICCHPVAFFLLPLLRHRDRRRFEYAVFANVHRPDHYTAKVKGLVDEWVSTTGLNPAEIGVELRRRRIDVLIDLGGHTGTTSVLAFADRAAPIQVSYLGYPGTTGLPTMDYRLTDAWADPVGDSEAHYTETLVRLPECAWCYEPPLESPGVSGETEHRPRPVTFGCFNTSSKWNESTLDAWGEIMAALPDARLKLKNRALGDTTFRAETVRRLESHGARRSQLDLRPMTITTAEHLAGYHDVDVALDTYPYHGTTTTVEAMWMGVPVVTLIGDDHRSRVGASLLRAAGRAEGLASDWDTYVARAIEMGKRGVRPGAARSELREQMKRSVLMDGAAFARRFEAALEVIWRRQAGESGTSD